MISRPRISPTTPQFQSGTTSQRTINRANSAVDTIAAEHGYTLPPASSRYPSAQEVRDRVAMLRRVVPDLSSSENTRLDRLDLKLNDLDEQRLGGFLGDAAVSSGVWDGISSVQNVEYAGGTTDTSGDLGALLRNRTSYTTPSDNSSN